MVGVPLSLQTLDLQKQLFFSLSIPLFFPPSLSLYLSSFFPPSLPSILPLCFLSPWLKLGYPQCWGGGEKYSFIFSNGTSVAHSTFTHVQWVRTQPCSAFSIQGSLDNVLAGQTHAQLNSLIWKEGRMDIRLTSNLPCSLLHFSFLLILASSLEVYL